jgi:hypothetical protein
MRLRPRHALLIGSGPRIRSGSLAMLAAMRRDSSRVRSFAAERLMSSLDYRVGKLLELRWHIYA